MDNNNEILNFFENDDYLLEIVHDDTVAMDCNVNYAMYQINGTRKEQQDSMDVCRKENSIMAAVCDGMGGLSRGELASSSSVKMLVDDYMAASLEDITGFLVNEVIRIDQAVSRMKDAEGNEINAGSTMVAVIIHDRKLHYVSVGDSRIYLMRGNEMELLTEDQNYGMTLRKSLREGKIDENKYRQEEKYADALISYIGMDGLKVIGCSSENPITLEPEDKVLLCSDGLYKSMSKEELEKELAACDMQNMEARLAEIVNLAYANSTGRHKKQDNTSAVLLIVT